MAMIPHLKQDYKEFIELLNSIGVKYVLTGAYAVAHHGAPRYTGDIDFLVEPSEANAHLVLQVLIQFGFASLKLTVGDLSKPDQVVQLGLPPTRIDILTSITGICFEDAFSNRVHGQIDGVAVSILSRDLLIRNKRATGRTKDLADAEVLENRGKNQGA